MQVISATEKNCEQTYSRIRNRLSNLKEMSRSNLALKRLVKRNMKREEKLAYILKNSSQREIEEKLGARDQICKLPFVVAKYTPDPSSIPSSSEGKRQGLLQRGNFLKVASKRPILAFDDRECLNQLDLSDSDPEVSSDAATTNGRAQTSVSRTFYRNSSQAPQKSARNGQFVDERLIDLLQRLPKDKRISLR